MENTIIGYTAGLGKYGLNMFDWIAGSVGATDKVKPAKTATQKPLIRGFTVNENATGKAVEFLYDEKTKLTKEKGSLNLENKKTQTKKIYENQSKLNFLNKATDAIGDISKKIREISNDDVLTAEQKRDKIKELSQQRNDIARNAKAEYKKTERPSLSQIRKKQ
jgi:vacuolar-type H+-ATPase subunit I/STV1